MWIKARTLFQEIQRILVDPDDEELVNGVMKTLQDSLSHLKNPLTNRAKTPTHRAQVSKPGAVVMLPNGGQVTMDAVLSTEAIILSDLFNVNELDALELVLTGELQVRNYDSMPRGLCAVVCYYQAHRYFVLVLKLLFRLRTSLDDAMPQSLNKFIDSFLMDSQFCRSIINILATFKVSTEFAKLQSPSINGLGSHEHQRVLRECIEDIGRSCYEILSMFSYCCSSTIYVNVINALFDSMHDMPSIEVSEKMELVHLASWTSLLVFLNPTKISKHLDHLKDVLDTFKTRLFEAWKNPSACASIALCYAVTVKSARNYPGGFRNQTEVDERRVVDVAVENGAFDFMRKYIIGFSGFSTYEITTDLIDTFFKSFISHFPEKVLELRNLGEDELANFDLDNYDGKTKLKLHFLKFLDLISQTYNYDTPKLILQAEQYFSEKFPALLHFVSDISSVVDPKLFVAYMDMLTALCRTEAAANYLLHSFDNFAENSVNNWNRLFRALAVHSQTFAAERKNKYVLYGVVLKDRVSSIIETSEVSALVTFIRFATAVAEHSEEAKSAFIENPRWNAIDLFTGIVIEGFPSSIKGAVFGFLAALASNERGSNQIWRSLIHRRICALEDEKLIGIVSEYEHEKESNLFPCTTGFLTVIKALVARRNIPESKYTMAYIRFIQLIMSDFCEKLDSSKEAQVMLELCCTSLNHLLRNFYATTDSIQVMQTQVHILIEFLNDSVLSRSLLRVIDYVAVKYTELAVPGKLIENLSLSALRLLTTVISQRQQFLAVAKSINKPIVVVSLEKMFLSPIVNPGWKGNQNYLSRLLTFLSSSPHMYAQTFFVVKILRQLCGHQPSLQPLLVTTFETRKTVLQTTIARLISVTDDALQITPVDVPLNDVVDLHGKKVAFTRVRGDIAKILIEALVASLDVAGSNANLAFLLCGYEMDLSSKVRSIESIDNSLTSLQSAIEIAEFFVTHYNPFETTFSGLFEPAFRLLHRLISFRNSSSSVTLRFLRLKHNLVYRLATSSNFKYRYEPIEQSASMLIDASRISFSANALTVNAIYRRAVQGVILQMVAAELAALLSVGQTSEPEKYFNLLLKNPDDETTQAAATTATTTEAAVGPTSSENAGAGSFLQETTQKREIALLWEILECGVTDSDSVVPPRLDKFSAVRIDELLNVCMKVNTSGVEEYDVDLVQFLLNAEINSVVTDAIQDILEEAHEILFYCVRFNVRRMLEAACIQLLSGWIAVVNVLSFFTPVTFLDVGIQKLYLQDAFIRALTYIIDMNVTSTVLAEISNTIFRVVRALSGVVEKTSTIMERRKELSFVLDRLFSCLVLPNYSRCYAFKFDIYGSIMNIFNVCGGLEDEEDVNLANTSLTALLVQRKTQESRWAGIFDGLDGGVVKTIAEDMLSAPYELKIVATTCMYEILRQDAVHSQVIASKFVSDNNVSCILSAVESLSIDLRYVADTSQRQPTRFLRVVLSLFSRLAMSAVGWNAIADYRVLDRISALRLWQKVPKGFFKDFDVAAAKDVNTPEGAYISLFSGLVDLSLIMLSGMYWKKLSCSLLQVVEKTEVFVTQLLKLQPDNELIKSLAKLVFVIHSYDEEAKYPIESTEILHSLLQLHIKGPEKDAFEALKKPSKSFFSLFALRA